MVKKLSILTSLIVIAVASYFFIKPKDEPITLINQSLDYNITPAFHPDSVVGFKWTDLASNKTFNFRRESRSTPWKPQVDNALIQDRLNLLSVLHQKESDSITEAEVEVEITFSNDSTWKGLYAKNQFLWLSGDQSDRGVYLNTGLESLFFTEGPQTFSKRRIKLCPSRLQKLSGRTFELENKPPNWIFNGKPLNRNLNTYVEQWLGRNCQIKVDHYFSSNNTSETIKEFTLFFIDETRSLIFYKNGIVELDGDRFYAKDFNLEFDRLLSDLR